MTLRPLPGRAKAVLGASLLLLAAAACDEDGKTAPDTCADPALQIFDIQDPPSAGGEGSEAANPCVTPIGHAVSPNAGTTSTPTGGSSSIGSGGMATSTDAGAGGA
jgi:hypothetical protein